MDREPKGRPSESAALRAASELDELVQVWENRAHNNSGTDKTWVERAMVEFTAHYRNVETPSG